MLNEWVEREREWGGRGILRGGGVLIGYIESREGECYDGECESV